MQRLRLVEHDEDEDTVRLLVEAFVPRDDLPRMLGYLGDNVGDHLRGAVRNVLGDGNQHFEQALFADELSAEGVARAREATRRHWQALIDEMVPLLEQQIERDVHAKRVRDQRLRIGLFTYNEERI